MPTPNNIYKNSARKLSMIVEAVENNYADAQVKASELRLLGEYHMVKVTRYKIGKRDPYNQTYHYAIRAYKKNG